MHFRISKKAFEWLLQIISRELQSKPFSARQTMDARKQVLAILWLLTTPNSYRSFGCSFDLLKGTLVAIFLRVITAPNGITPSIISWPNAEERNIISVGYTKFAGINGVIGAVDGTYVRIKTFGEIPRFILTENVIMVLRYNVFVTTDYIFETASQATQVLFLICVYFEIQT